MKNQHIPFELINDLKLWLRNNPLITRKDKEVIELKKITDVIGKLQEMSIEIPGDLLKKRDGLEVAVNTLNDDEKMLQALADELISISIDIKRRLGKSSVKIKSPPKKLRVTLPNGKIICEDKSVDTFIKTLQFMGLDRCAMINTVTQLGHPVVATKPNEYKDKQPGNIKKIDRYFIETKTNTDRKAEQLREYARELDIDIQVESIE
jgi:hypothetical protein